MIDETSRFVIRSNGLVTEERTVVTSTIPLKDFFQNMSQMAPRDVVTPPLPLNTVRYAMSGGTRGGHVITLFQPSRVMTIFYKSMQQRNATPIPYNLSFPHLLFKMVFNASQVISEVRVAVIKERPTRLQDQLFIMAMPNVHPGSDLVCMTPSTTPGDITESCAKTLDEFFTGQNFNDDLAQWPDGVRSFEDWQTKSTENPRFIETVEWEYLCTFGEWTSGSGIQNRN